MVENLRVVFPWDTLRIIPDRLAVALDEHLPLIEAIRLVDAEAVRDAMSQHILEAAHAFLEPEDGLGLNFFGPR